MSFERQSGGILDRANPQQSPGWVESLLVIQRELFRMPDALLLLLISSGFVIWAFAAGKFPFLGRAVAYPMWVTGPVVVVCWMALFAMMALTYVQHAPCDRRRTIIRRLAWCLVIVALCGPAPYMLQSLSHSMRSRYLSKLYILACLLLSIGILLPDETRNLWRESRLRSLLRNRWHCVWLGLVTMALVFLAETLFFAESGAKWAYYPSLDGHGLLLNTFILVCAICLVYAAVNRLALAAGVVYLLYAAFVACNLAKVHYMHAAMQPLDLQYIADFLPFFRSFMERPAAMVLVASGVAGMLMLVWLWRRWTFGTSLANRSRLAACAAAGLAALLGAVCFAPTNALLARAGVRTVPWNSIESVSENGMLLEMALELPSILLRKPDGYSEAAVARSVHLLRSQREGGTLQGKQQDPVDLIVYMVESLMDPRDLGIRVSSEPVPTLRAMAQSHTSGYAIVPGLFGESGNSEFELLAGMAMYFLPQRSCPYKQYIKRDLPALAWLLRQHGYRTVSVIADPPSLYNRKQALSYLGFEQTIWLAEQPGVRLDVAQRCPSDEEVVDAILQASRSPGPCFIYAFPNSTHSPYNYDHYLNSDLDIAEPMAEPARREIKTYLNALRAADASIARLLNHFQHSPRKTMIVVLGDHLPPLAWQGGLFASAGARRSTELEWVEKQHRVPLLIWSNFLAKQNDVVYSLNFLATYLLERMRIEPDGFFAANDAIRSRLSVLSAYVQTADSARFERSTIPEADRAMIDAYWLIQYDILVGRRYALRPRKE